MSMPQKLVRRIERAKVLDEGAEPVAKTVRMAVRPRLIRNLLSGTNLGHPLHPTLTDVTIGAWCMGSLLDAVGRRQDEMAADLLVGAGVVAGVPTALSGFNDAAYTRGGSLRVAFVHALINTTALSLYTASAIARAKGDRTKGKALGYAGFGMMSVGAYLGGHLSFVKGVNVSRNAWEEGPEEWTPVMGADELTDGQHRVVDAAGVQVLLHKMDGKVYGLAATCSHLGGPLGEGTFEHGCVTCPWHGSTFRFSDGGIRRGPASSPQPTYETRIEGGRIEVRLAPAGIPRATHQKGTSRTARRVLARIPS